MKLSLDQKIAVSLLVPLALNGASVQSLVWLESERS